VCVRECGRRGALVFLCYLSCFVSTNLISVYLQGKSREAQQGGRNDPTKALKAIANFNPHYEQRVLDESKRGGPKNTKEVRTREQKGNLIKKDTPKKPRFRPLRPRERPHGKDCR